MTTAACRCNHVSVRMGLCPHDYDSECIVGCVWDGEEHDGECLTEDDVADATLEAKDREGWART